MTKISERILSSIARTKVYVLFVVPIEARSKECAEGALEHIRHVVQNVLNVHGSPKRFEVDNTHTNPENQTNGAILMDQADYEDPLAAVHLSVVSVAPPQQQQTRGAIRRRAPAGDGPPPPPTRRQLAETLARAFCTLAGDEMHAQARLQLVDRDAYFTDCTPIHQSWCEMQRFSVGSFLNFGTYLERAVIEPHLKRRPDPARRSVSQVRNGCQDRQRQPSGDELSKVKAIFEHDRRRLAVEFFTPSPAGVHHKLKVEYDAIDGVLADVNEADATADLYLTLAQPLTVFEGVHRNSGFRLTPFREQRDFVRVKTWPGCRESVVTDCNTIRLRFKYELNASASVHGIFELVGRLRAQLKCPVWFAPVKMIALPHSFDYKGCYFVEEFYREMYPCPSFLSQQALYSLQGLLRRGCVVKDQLLLHDTRKRLQSQPDHYQKFIDTVEKYFHRNQKATEEALDQLLDAFDDRGRTLTVLNVFTWSFKRIEKWHADGEPNTELFLTSVRSDIPENMLLLPKVIVTPTRIIPLPKEVMMGNRILNRWKCAEGGDETTRAPDNFVRVIFRDDNGKRIGQAHCHEGRPHCDVERRYQLIDKSILEVLNRGLFIGKYHYQFLAWSNSQLRESGCYMYAETNSGVSAAAIRDWMGVFKDKHGVPLLIPKKMARMGQCFTQGQKSIDLLPDDYVVEGDVLSHSLDPSSGEPYTFSDGVGRISPSCAKEAFLTLPDSKKWLCVPSAFQIRFQGMKGMLCVDPRLDQMPIAGKMRKIVFRDSMNKFQCPDEQTLELVKWSKPVGVTLNRPLNMILDQVSEKRGPAVHRRVKDHVLGVLMERQLRDVADVLIDEHKAAGAITERLSSKIDGMVLRQQGFSLTTEPFLRSLLLAVFKFNIHHQLLKQHIEIPNGLGRTLYGVLDETGRLQYGQIFVQYSSSMNTPGIPGKSTQILTGRVLVTKNPCVHAGDVRMLEAVDVEPLRHLVDVIVFPRYGPRPHSDEMAGSDLDGDEYSVIWDRELDFVKNEDAMVYLTESNRGCEFTDDTKGMCDYFVNYIQGDNVGMVASAHLINADLHGLMSEPCVELAALHSKAVDFPKTGKAVGSIPQELRASKAPDFMEKDHKPTYQSKYLVGDIYRTFHTMSVVVDTSSEHVLDTVVCDRQLIMPDITERDRRRARRERDSYTNHMQMLMDAYGIDNEAALVSGRLITIRNRIGDRDKDDYTLYNTDKVIQMRYNRLVARFRTRFFEEFGGDETQFWPKDSNDQYEVRYVTSRTCTDDAMLRKASAWYASVYDDRERTRFLSFAWLVWDLLAIIKGKLCLGELEHNPIMDRINKQLDDLLPRGNQLEKQWGPQLNKMSAITAYCRRYRGLRDVCLVLCEWGDCERVFDGPLHQTHLCLLLIQFGIGVLGGVDRQRRRLMAERVNALSSSVCALPPIEFTNRRSELLVQFLGYMASRQFHTLSRLAFSEFQLEDCFRRGEWRTLSQVSFKAFYSLSMVGDLKALRLNPREGGAVVEMPPFMIDLEFPSSKDKLDRLVADGIMVGDDDIAQFWKKKTGCESVFLRRPALDRGGTYDYKRYEVMVSARGTVEQLSALRQRAMAVPDFSTAVSAYEEVTADGSSSADNTDNEYTTEARGIDARRKTDAVNDATRRFKTDQIQQEMNASTREHAGGFGNGAPRPFGGFSDL